MTPLTFSRQRFVTWHNFKQPLIEDPPAHPLPDIHGEIDLFGDILLKYPLAEHAVPAMQAPALRAISRFRVIMNEAGKLAWSSPGSSSRITLQSALDLKSRLDEWYEGLPEPLAAKNIVLPCHLKLQ